MTCADEANSAAPISRRTFLGRTKTKTLSCLALGAFKDSSTSCPTDPKMADSLSAKAATDCQNSSTKR